MSGFQLPSLDKKTGLEFESEYEDTLEAIQEQVENTTGLNLLRKTRLVQYVRARNKFIMKALHAGFNQSEIGRFLKMDPSTINYHVKPIWEKRHENLDKTK